MALSRLHPGEGGTEIKTWEHTQGFACVEAVSSLTALTISKRLSKSPLQRAPLELMNLTVVPFGSSKYSHCRHFLKKTGQMMRSNNTKVSKLYSDEYSSIKHEEDISIVTVNSSNQPHLEVRSSHTVLVFGCADDRKTCGSCCPVIGRNWN